MAKPWEKYQAPASIAAPAEPSARDIASGPWDQYAQRTPPITDEAAVTPQPEDPGMLSSMLHSKPVEYGLKALDYPGGVIRTGLATGAGLLAGENVVDSDDVVNTLKGKAPTSAEYLERLGVTPGPELGGVSLRDAEGFALDVVTDPLTLISKGVKALRPAGVAAEKGGASLYKSGLKKVDEKLAEKGAKDISDVLLESGGKVGTTKQLAKETEKILKKAGAERAALYEKAAEKGVTIDMGFPMAQAEKKIAKLAKDPGLAPMAEQFTELLERYKKAGKVDIATLSEWKTNLYNALPATAYDVHGKLKGPAAEFKQALANDFKNTIVGAGNKAEKGLGDKIDKLNETMQAVIESRRPMKMQARRANTPNNITAVDAMLGSVGGLIGGVPGAIIPVAAKKGIQAANTTLGRTAMGKGLLEAGKSGVPDALIRQGIIEAERRKRRGLLPPAGGLLSEGYEQ